MKYALALAFTLAGTGCSTPASQRVPNMPASESTTTLSVGDAAPPFTLAAPDGSEVSLASLTASGPAVLVFYRGDW